ncbi:response regulator [Paraglaciecola sp. 20A4]|uniref:response regulator transcription factor n=1 Tax=Paraglaciecola sp. 20A4 TaxID=2687288 RepID=UPI00140DAFF6|nr:response regulator [Paraglaciecola sp. 20A4]
MPSKNAINSNQPVVYIVDHHKSVLLALSALLAPLNVSIKCFTSAELFLNHKMNNEAACLILEAHLQEKRESGIELLETLVRQGFHIPTIVLASSSDIPTAVRAMRASAIDFIEKPYIEHLLVQKVAEILHQSAPTQMN